MVTDETVDRLLQAGDPAVSLYCPLEPEQRDIRAQEARFQDLLKEASAMMERDGMDPHRREELLEPLTRIVQEADLAHHRDPGLAVFAAPGFSAVETLPRPVPASVTVGPDFHIKPLLPLLQVNRAFYILALSKAQVRLLAATPFTCTEVPLEALPADAQAELDGLPAGVLSDPEARAEQLQALLTQSPQRIDGAVKAALGTQTAPLVLVADPQVAGEFQKHTAFASMIADTLTVNPFALSDTELVERALEGVRPLLSAELDRVLEQAVARLGTAEPTVAIRLEEILTAAHEGRVDAVVVAEDDTLWGHYTPDQVLTAHGTRAPGDEDLLNQAAVLTLRQGGRAYALPQERLPRHAPACALLRF